METQIRKLKERVVEAHKNKRNQPCMPSKENNYQLGSIKLVMLSIGLVYFKDKFVTSLKLGKF